MKRSTLLSALVLLTIAPSFAHAKKVQLSSGEKIIVSQDLKNGDVISCGSLAAKPATPKEVTTSYCQCVVVNQFNDVSYSYLHYHVVNQRTGAEISDRVVYQGNGYSSEHESRRDCERAKYQNPLCH